MRKTVDGDTLLSDGESRVTYRRETITPERAASLLQGSELLKTATIDPKTVRQYASAMKAGGWIENGLPIILDEEGRLVDGHHRLQACIQADVPFTTMVASGVRADTLHTIDQHRRRTFAGVLEARGVPHAGDVHRSLVKLIRIENGVNGLMTTPISWSRLDVALASNPEILDAAAISDDLQGSCLPRGARTPFLFMAIRAGRLEEALDFFARMEDESAPSNAPARMLAITIMTLEANLDRREIEPDVGLALAIRAFSDHIDGKTALRPYAWRPDYGKVDLDEEGRPISPGRALKRAPANAGMPEMPGYPGVRNARVESPKSLEDHVRGFGTDTAEILKAAASRAGDGIQVREIQLTPELAEEWLAKYNSVNRAIQRTHVGRIARDIRNGNWMVNAQPICFAGDPFDGTGTARLLNGQHRLKACALAGAEIEVPVAVHVPEEAYATYDMYRKRSKRAMSGAEASFARSAAVLQWREDNGLALDAAQRPTETEIGDTLEAHPELLDFGYQVRRADRKGRPDEIATGAVMTYVLYRSHGEDRELAEQFYEGLRSGAGLEVGNPILALRRTALARRRGAERMNRYESVQLLLDGWERFKTWSERARKGGPSRRVEAQAEAGASPSEESDITAAEIIRDDDADRPGFD
jgi:hypothetical protein